jgi:hypothetical protein
MYLAKMAKLYNQSTRRDIYKDFVGGNQQQLNSTINAGFGDVDPYASFDMKSYNGPLKAMLQQYETPGAIKRGGNNFRYPNQGQPQFAHPSLPQIGNTMAPSTPQMSSQNITSAGPAMQPKMGALPQIMQSQMPRFNPMPGSGGPGRPGMPANSSSILPGMPFSRPVNQSGAVPMSPMFPGQQQMVRQFKLPQLQQLAQSRIGPQQPPQAPQQIPSMGGGFGMMGNQGIMDNSSRYPFIGGRRPPGR